MFHLTNYFKANTRVTAASANSQNIASTQQPRGQLLKPPAPPRVPRRWSPASPYSCELPQPK